MESRWIYEIDVESIWNLWGRVKYSRNKVFGCTELATGTCGEGDDTKGCVEKQLKVMGWTVDIASTIISVK